MTKYNRICLGCGEDLPEGAHFNRKYCNNKCSDKARYEREGQRSTSEQRKIWYEKRKSKKGYIERLRERARNRSISIKKFLAEYKVGRGCIDCGYDEHHAALDFDHVFGEKAFNVCYAKSIKSAEKEIEKCEVVCANCHRKRTYERYERTYDAV